MTRSFAIVYALAISTFASLAIAQDAKGPYDDAIAKIQQRSEALDRENANVAYVKVWPGVIADRRAQTVTIMGVATGIKRTDPLEFYMTPVESGKDYEALAVTPAKPSHIAAALMFINLKPGLPIDPEKNRFWARGSRLITHFTIAGKTKVDGNSVMVDTNTGKTIAGDLLFAGSYTFVDDKGVKHFAADEADARPLAPTYEDRAAVLAVPRRAMQSIVYGFQKPSDQTIRWTRGDSVDMVLSPIARGDPGNPFVLSDPMATPFTIALRVIRGDTHYIVTGPLSRDRGTEYPRVSLIVEFISISTHNLKTDIFTDVTIDDDVPVTKVRNLYAVLSTIEQDRGVKLNPPPADGLYYRAFLPDEAWRDRNTRLGEPWELFLKREVDAKLSARLERSVDNPDRGAAETKIVEKENPADPAAFAKHVNDHASRWSRTIFIYPPPDLTYGELMTWVRPVLATYPRVFVFPAEGPATQPTTQPATQPAN
ncbi:MAG: hypothetical protein JWM57_1351 [Phycisphaerales bacterium]|nr:hypothetical protein [Phycisphaerales bacterium]